MSRASALGAVLFADEAAWGEDVSTYDARVAVIGQVDASGLEHAKVDSDRTTQHLSDYTHPIRTVQGGTVRTRLYVPGHGSATTGAMSLDDHETLLGYAVGNASASASGTTVSGGGSTATSLTVAAAAGFAPGSIVFVGTLGDGRGNGQAAVVVSHAASTITLATALPGAPGNGDPVASAAMIYPFESASAASITPARFALLSANHSYEAHGCFPQSLTLEGLSPGELPVAEIGWGVSWWADSEETFPTATGMDTHNPAPCAGGSLFIQEAGTATRQTYSARAFRVSVDLGTAPLMGPDGGKEFQSVVGAVRTKQTVQIEIEVDAGNASEQPVWGTRWDSDTQDYHILYTLNGGSSGRRGAIYLPRACIVDRRPTQFAGDRVNRERIVFRGKTNSTTSSELVASAWRLAQG
jgi:hypothetical protein